MTDALARLLEYVQTLATTASLGFGDTLALTLTADDVALHHLPPGLLDHAARLVDLIGTPDQVLIVLITHPGRLPPETRGWLATRTTLAADHGTWMHAPVITDLDRWWQLEPSHTRVTGPGTPL